MLRRAIEVAVYWSTLRSFSSDKEPGTFRFSHGQKQCLTCPFVVFRTSVTGPKSALNITDYFHCTKFNVIYCIQCSHCNQFHIAIGETGRYRIRDNLYDIRKNSISNFIAFGLSFWLINGGNNCRKTKELRLIHILVTLNPHRINERFTNFVSFLNLFVF
mgnify:CR=1 FL=1